MNINGFHIGLPDTRFEIWVTVFAVVFGFIFCCLVVLFIKYAGKGTVHFIREALSDPSGHGDIKYVLAALITLMALIPCVILGLIFNRWIPEYIIWPLVLTITGLAGASSLDFSSAMKSGKAILKAEPPKDKIVDTDKPAPTVVPAPVKTPVVPNEEGDGSV